MTPDLGRAVDRCWRRVLWFGGYGGASAPLDRHAEEWGGGGLLQPPSWRGLPEAHEKVQLLLPPPLLLRMLRCHMTHSIMDFVEGCCAELAHTYTALFLGKTWSVIFIAAFAESCHGGERSLPRAAR